MKAVPTSRLRAADVLRVGASGPRARKLRTALSALGVSIGIAAMVGVLGLSESSKSALLDEISALGTNLLTVESGGGFGSGDGALPEWSSETIGRVPTVEVTSAVYDVDASVLKNEFVDPGQTGGLTVVAADDDLVDTLNGEVAFGTWFGETTTAYPTVVLGSVAAERLGVWSLDQQTLVEIGGEYVEVVGVLEEFPLADDLDRAAIMPAGAAQTFFDAEPGPTTIYTRIEDGAIDETREIIPATARRGSVRR